MKVIKEAISNLDAEDANVVLDPTLAGAVEFSERREKEAEEIMKERTPEPEEQPKVEMAKLNLDEALEEPDFDDWDEEDEECDCMEEEICPICGDDVDEPCEDCKKEMAEMEEEISDVNGSVGSIIKEKVFPKIDGIASTGELLELVKNELADVDPKFRKYADEVIRNLAKKPLTKACIYLGDIVLKGEGLGSPDMHEEICPECGKDVEEPCPECEEKVEEACCKEEVCPDCGKNPCECEKEEIEECDQMQVEGCQKEEELEECGNTQIIDEARGEDISLYDRVYIDLDKQSGDDAKYRKFGKEFNSRRYNGPDEIFAAREDDGITVAADDLSFAQEVADAYDLDTKDDELDVKRIDDQGNEVWITKPALTILIPNEFEEAYVEDIEGLEGLAEAYSRYFH